MTSQSLYRKWRSQTFDDLIGQEPIIRALKNELKNGKLSHAYLFTGPRGTGKTSTARLLAKTVNCENPRDGEPCNVCMQCREITAGNSLNVIEIDAASNRGIDNIRELRDRVMVPPTNGKYKVYVLDEAHMLTAEAFNALLKTLEEPPEYAIFILATTDVHKMLPTVISRCQPFYFKRITTREIVQRLQYVAEQEGIKLERPAAELIARSAAGGMRDALSLLDQSIAYAGSEISQAQVQSMLGIADPRAITNFITAVAELDGSTVLHLINQLSEDGADLRQVNMQVMEYWRALMLTRAGADAAAILDLTEEEAREVKQIAQRFALEELTECARIFAQNDLALKNQGTPQLGLELGALEAIETHRRSQSGQLAAKPISPQAQPARPFAPPAPPAPPLTPADYPARSTQPAQAPRNTPAREAEAQSAAPEKVPRPQEELASAPSRQEAVPAAQHNGHMSLSAQQVIDAWESVRKRTKQKSKSGLVAAHLAYYKVIGIEGSPENPMVVIQAGKQNQYQYVRDENRYKDLEWALEMEFGLPCRVRLVPPDQTPSLAPMSDAASYSTGAALAPQPSAYREPPLPAQPSPALQDEEPPESVRTQQQDTPPLDLYGSTGAATLARTNVVRENKQVVSEDKPVVSKETLEQKVRHDPVVQEVMRTFSARIVDIQPK
ncbi:MAG TPA: DNA polymerase III subunit gamma/tau [Ktedonobacteraceae bacterium]|nr:DNA polymerase III subunit gamma/tau [Ktedonobacteraceae bacterium]